MKKIPYISIIIPALNEAKHLPKVFFGLQNQSFPRCGYEIIFVDNGSTDNTKEIVSNIVDKYIEIDNSSVSFLRNEGAKIAKGRLLAFLDADCVPEKCWLEKAVDIYNREILAFGNKVGIPKTSGWIEKAWFSQNKRYEHKTNYINSGNFFIDKRLFDKIGGFNEELRSGEDTDICERIRKKGILILSNPDIKVVHLKNPKTIKDFIKREIWHGMGSVQAFSYKSLDKPLLFSFFFDIFHLTLLFGAFKNSIIFNASIVSIISLLSISTLYNVVRFKNFKYALQIFILYYFYFIGRSISIVIVFRNINCNLSVLNLLYCFHRILARFVYIYKKIFNLKFTGLRIICYHSLTKSKNETIFPKTTVFINEFEKQIDYLISEGYKSIGFTELEDFLDGKFTLNNEKYFLITFDDGFKNIKDYAIPYLERNEIHCIVFICTDFIDERKSHEFIHWNNKTEINISDKIKNKKYNEYRLVNEKEIIELDQNKYVLIGSHSCSHYNFNDIPEIDQRYQLLKSKEKLESILKKPIDHFAFPNGAYNYRSYNLSREYYKYIYSVEKGIVNEDLIINLVPIKRHSINYKTTFSDFKIQVNGGYDYVNRAFLNKYKKYLMTPK